MGEIVVAVFFPCSNLVEFLLFQRARKRKLSHPVQYSAAVAAATSKSDDSLSETGGESNSVTTNDTNDHNNEGQEDPTKH